MSHLLTTKFDNVWLGRKLRRHHSTKVETGRKIIVPFVVCVALFACQIGDADARTNQETRRSQPSRSLASQLREPIPQNNIETSVSDKSQELVLDDPNRDHFHDPHLESATNDQSNDDLNSSNDLDPWVILRETKSQLSKDNQLGDAKQGQRYIENPFDSPQNETLQISPHDPTVEALDRHKKAVVQEKVSKGQLSENLEQSGGNSEQAPSLSKFLSENPSIVQNQNQFLTDKQDQQTHSVDARNHNAQASSDDLTTDDNLISLDNSQDRKVVSDGTKSTDDFETSGPSENNEPFDTNNTKLVDVSERKQPLEQPSASSRRIVHPQELDDAIKSIRTLKRDLLATFEVTADIDESVKAEHYAVMTPRVDDVRWNQAMELLVANRCQEARKIAESLVGPTDSLNSDSDPGVRYAMARIDLCANASVRGRKVLEELAKRNDAIGSMAANTLGKPKENDPYDQPIERVSDLIQDALQLGKQGKVKKALSQLDELYGLVDSRHERFNVRLAQANILETARRLDEAAQIYLQLYRRTRGSAANARIEDRLERLERLNKTTYLSFGERVDRMRHLISRGRYRDAKQLSIYNAKLRGFDSAQLKGMTYFREALVAERKKDRSKAVQLFEKANRLVKDDEVRPRIYLGWAKALRRLDRDREAISLYKKLATEYPNHYLRGEAHYQAGRLYQFLDDNEDAIVEFDAALATLQDNGEREDDPSWAADALWRVAFSNILLERWDRAIDRLARLESRFGDETDASDLSLGLKANYWMAVAHLKAGRLHMAQKGFQKTIRRGKLTWYGRLAAARLDKENMPYTTQLPKRLLSSAPFHPDAKLDSDALPPQKTFLNHIAVEKDPRLAIAVEFGKLGLWRDARYHARPLLKAHPSSKGAATIVASAELIEGNAPSAHWQMRPVIDEAGPNQFTLQSWATAYPSIYSDLAQKFGAKYNVDPNLVQAIIRQESGFHPKVKSHAGAVGLMQLMPGTARYTAREFLKDQSYSRRALTNPETNIELGTMYIRLQTAYAGDSIPIALAAYNAGTGPLSTWLQRYGDRDLDAWVESITYQEARGYVRKVFTSYVSYSQIYSGILPNVDLDAPRKLKKNRRTWGDLPELKKPSS